MSNILFIVEGKSEAKFYSEVLAECTSTKVFFEVTMGDIFSDTNISIGIQDYVSQLLNDWYKEDSSNRKFDLVIILTDIDACFLIEKYIKENRNLCKNCYALDYMEVRSISDIFRRNMVKGFNMNSMLDCTDIKVGNQIIPLEMYYNCVHLEDVYLDIKNPEKYKVRYAQQMVRKYVKNIEAFFEVLKNKLPSEDFTESWEYLTKDANSLKSLTNLALFFSKHRDFLKEEYRPLFESIERDFVGTCNPPSNKPKVKKMGILK